MARAQTDQSRAGQAMSRNDLRLFVGIYPPPDLAHRLLRTLGELDLPEHRITSSEQLHLTLQFIGDTPAKDLARTVESIERSASGLNAFTLTPGKLISLPERGPARLVAVETDRPPTLLELQKRLAHRLARNVRQRAGDRFRPHLTLCRFRAPTRIEAVDVALALEGMPVRELRLMRSALSHAGARHEVIAAFELKET